MIDEDSNLKFWPNFRRLTGQLAKSSLKIFFDELCFKEKKKSVHTFTAAMAFLIFRKTKVWKNLLLELLRKL